MLCKDVMYEIEKEYPLNYALSWDNVGLLVGRDDKEVKRIYIALDATDEVIDEAVRTGADMLITHHPMIFSPIKRIHNLDFVGERILKLIQNDISYYAMHTNFDTIGGMAKEAAKMLGIQNMEVLEETRDGEGIGQTGQLPYTRTVRELASEVKEKFGLKNVTIYGNLDKKVDKVAICPGSGRSVIGVAVKKEADCLISGDIGHHEGLDACEQGVAVIDASHYGLEQIFMYIMRDYIRGYNPDMEIIIADEGVPFAIV